MSGNARKWFAEVVSETATKCDPRLDVLEFDVLVLDVFFRTCQLP